MGFRRVTTALAAVLAASLISSVASAQTAVFSGRVTSEAGQPLGGASVGIADAEGRYTFTIDVASRSGRTANVVARYIGYKPKRLPVTLSSGRVEHNFTLEKDVLSLEEVVVTGTSEATSQKKATFSVGVVDNTQIREVPASSPLGAISGKIPGASVISPSGQPGSAPAIRLRSATSLTGRQDPLVIIDGTISRLTLADVNSEDIERIEVIKGAAASSLYGSDAANGVVQIFTKRGANLAEGQTSFTIRNEVGQNHLPKVIEGSMHHNYQMNAAGTDFLRNANGERIPDADGIADNDYPVYYDQLRKVFRPGTFFTNYVSVGQRRGTTNFNASFQNQRDGGVLSQLDGFSRQNFRLNVDQSLTENIDLGMGAFYGRSHSDQGEDTGLFFGLRFLEPNIKIDSVLTSGPLAGAFNPVIKQAPLSGNVVNPLYVLQQNEIARDRDRFTGTFRAAYRPLTWLTGETNIGYDQSSQGHRDFTPIGFSNSSGATGSGVLFHRTDADRAYNANFTLTSSRGFMNDQIRNTSKAAYLYEDQSNSFVSIIANQLTVPKVTEFSAADPAASIVPGSRTETIRAQNVFFVTTFDIKDRYILDGLVRQDKSSLFGSEERTQVYHRLSGAWRVTEDFAIPGFDELKLRAGVGTAGLRPPFTAQYETFTLLGGAPEPVNLGNRNLRPAFSREAEIGFNANFLTNYSLEYSVSRKTTTDQILRVPLSAATGYQTQWQNAGALKGTTHEVSLAAILLSKADYFWRMNITGDRTRQKITDLKVGAFLVGPSETTTNTQIFRIAKGEPFGVIYGSKWIRTQAQLEETIATGQLGGTAADYVVNEEGFYVVAADHRTVDEVPLKFFQCTARDTGGNCTASGSVVQIGDVNPDFNAGFNTTAQWKGLGVNATVNWVKGGNIYNYTRHWPFNEFRDAVIDQSSKPVAERKPTTYYSSFYNNFDPNDYFVEDGSYIRLRELAVNYTLPANWVSKIPVGGFRSARLGLVGRNLFTSTDYTGYDPDVTGPGGGNPFAYRVDYFTYPAYRTFTAMLELGF
jgi:TonB-linked SusC/RagA family outer membrane protein